MGATRWCRLWETTALVVVADDSAVQTKPSLAHQVRDITTVASQGSDFAYLSVLNSNYTIRKEQLEGGR